MIAVVKVFFGCCVAFHLFSHFSYMLLQVHCPPSSTVYLSIFHCTLYPGSIFCHFLQSLLLNNQSQGFPVKQCYFTFERLKLSYVSQEKSSDL